MTAADWQSELRSRGYRLTPQRQLVLDAVRELGHGTPDEIAGAVRAKAPSVNLSTVYRTLDVLQDVGLITHTHLGHGAPTYHPADESDHVHLVCTACDDIIAVPAEAVDQLVGSLRDLNGFEVDVTHMAMHGRCAGCAGSDESAATDEQERQ